MKQKQYFTVRVSHGKPNTSQTQYSELNATLPSRREGTPQNAHAIERISSAVHRKLNAPASSGGTMDTGPMGASKRRRNVVSRSLEVNSYAERPQETITMKRIRVLIADDTELLRTIVRERLERAKVFEVVGEARDGVEVVHLAQTCRPDVVLMDISMPHKDGLVATAELTRKFPQLRVIVFSFHDDAALVQQVIRAGAAGYLVKAKDVKLEVAITAVANGQTYFDPIISRHVPDDARKQRSSVPCPTRPNSKSDDSQRHIITNPAGEPKGYD